MTTDPFVCPCCGADAAKLRIIADWFDYCYQGPSGGTDVQDDLREWAAKVDAVGTEQ